MKKDAFPIPKYVIHDALTPDHNKKWIDFV
jgi:hypothetical protein